ncbi:50S ribosomal protein L10 [Candidatus Peregrinibacteria bacterium CG10_big_fil_rev_8_21_14_0_10_49_10]|nr:MAG: 50S ribosomal protein L10 [Candidatus Peregrinibacteria bacterium CG10_big_fil_rev_8_21_14_0_10_49_10]
MALTKDQKQAQVKELTEKMNSASSIILAHYIGLSVSEVSELRKKLRENDAEMKVGKKTLMHIAAKEAGLPEFDEKNMEGPVSLIFSFGDPLSGAQVAFKFAKDHDKVKLLGGLYDGKVLTKEEAVALAQMPSRDVLLATFVCMIRSPLVSFAGICNSPLSGFARALKELAEKGGVHPAGESAPAETAEAEKPTESAAPAEAATEATVAPASTQEEPNESAEENAPDAGAPEPTANA